MNVQFNSDFFVLRACVYVCIHAWVGGCRASTILMSAVFLHHSPHCMLRQGPVPPSSPLLELKLAGLDSLVKPAYSMDPLSPPYWWSPYPPSINVSIEELNSGPHSCVANPLLTEPSPSSVDFQFGWPIYTWKQDIEITQDFSIRTSLTFYLNFSIYFMKPGAPMFGAYILLMNCSFY